MMNITVKLSAKLQTKKLFIILSLDWEISDIGFMYILIVVFKNSCNQILSS